VNITVLTRYQSAGASSRIRFYQYFGLLERIAGDLNFRTQALLGNGYLSRKYQGASTVAQVGMAYAARAASSGLWRTPDIWWLEKELWPWGSTWLESLLLARRPYVLDIDDAIFHTYDTHRSGIVRRLYGKKIDTLMAGAALVTAGNEYLADRARSAGAPWVEIVPTAIDLERYPLRAMPTVSTPRTRPLVVGWIGSPATVKYLGAVIAPLARLAESQPVRLHVIGASAPPIPGVEIVSVPWTEESEVNAISNFDVGIMPLPDSPWERGKCGYKLIQYMACGIPVLASPVGVNAQLVRPGETGYLASNADEWHEGLRQLALDPAIASRMGATGRRLVEESYCLQVTAPRIAGFFRQIHNGKAA